MLSWFQKCIIFTTLLCIVQTVLSQDVCMSVCLSHTGILVFLYQMARQYSDEDPLTVAKIAIFDQCLALGSMTAGVSSVINFLTVE